MGYCFKLHWKLRKRRCRLQFYQFEWAQKQNVYNSWVNLHFWNWTRTKNSLKIILLTTKFNESQERQVLYLLPEEIWFLFHYAAHKAFRSCIVNVATSSELRVEFQFKYHIFNQLNTGNNDVNSKNMVIECKRFIRY